MMAGVEIVNVKEALMDFPVFLLVRMLIVLCVVTFLFLAGLLILFVIDRTTSLDVDGALTGWALFVMCLLLAAQIATIKVSADECPKETIYDIVVSDEVSFNELNEHYEIIEQNGKILTVRERK